MEPLCISLVGLNRWDSEFVQTTVNIASGIEIAPWKFVEDPYRADVLLVDAARSRHQLLNRNDGGSARSSNPIVVSFKTDETSDSAIEGRGLTRPVKYAELIAVLKDIEQELRDAATTRQPKKTATRQQEEVSLRPVIRAPKKEQPASRLIAKSRPARRFVEGTRFIGLVKQALRRGRPVEIRHPDFPTVQIFPEVFKYMSTEEVTSRPGMFRESALRFSIREISEAGVAAALSTSQCRPIGPLVYSAALFGSEGRLVLNCNPDDKLRLIDWPDFDHVPHVAQHKQLARFMLANNSSLLDIAAATGVRIGTVIGFCNACEAAGIVRRTPVTKNIRTDAESGGGNHHGVQMLERIRELFKSP